MTFTDQTAAFRSLAAGPSTPPRASSRSASRARQRKPDFDPEFLKEAYRIHNHLSSLSNHLQTIWKPYLSVAEAPLARRRRGPVGEGDRTQWDGVKYLSDRDREEIDQRGKMILRRCRERVGILEDGERVAPPHSTLFSLLPSLAPKPASTADAVVTAHRAAVILTLSTLLARTTANLSALQEERSRRRAERGRTLGEGAEREAQMPMSLPQVETDLNLSPSQIQAFESENNALITHLESTLSSVLAAEKSLLEVSELQTQLVQQLVQQTEMVNLLYEQAVGSVGEMRGAEQQLKRAKERGGEARLFLLVFLIGASLALLFLDWYK